MTPDQYFQDAIRTESRVEKIQANQDFVQSIITSIIALSLVLDQIKKNVFYNKKINEISISTNLHCAQGLIGQLIDNIITQEVHPMEQKTDLCVDTRLFHAIVGIATESSELLETLKFDGTPIDTVNLLEEFGDLNWYQAIGINASNGTFSGVLETNIAKLKSRYGDKFSSEAAINRNVVTERAILEGQQIEQSST